MNYESAIRISLEDTITKCEQVAREVYYALSFLPPVHPSRANLEQALEHLGVRSPRDVGLSENLIKRRVGEARVASPHGSE